MPRPIPPPAPAGDWSDLLRVARGLPNATEKHVNEIADSLLEIAVHFLSRKYDAERDKRSARDERDRYERIAASAKILRESLGRLASPGRLLGPLADWVDAPRREPADTPTAPPKKARRAAPKVVDHHTPIPDTASAARAICWPSWKEKSHPLYLIEKLAKKEADALTGMAKKAGAATLNARRNGAPETELAMKCAELLPKINRERPTVSESGELARLVGDMWRYAMGENPPDSLGHHAKKAARELRSTPEPKCWECFERCDRCKSTEPENAS